LLAEMKSLSGIIKENDEQLRELESKINTFLSALPNIPAEDVVSGGKENNQVLRHWDKNPNLILNLRIMSSLLPVLD
jgi:seryl-tRNA synthetase